MHADAWTTAQTCTNKRHGDGIDFLYSTPAHTKQCWQSNKHLLHGLFLLAFPKQSKCPCCHVTMMWRISSFLSSEFLWNGSAESDGLEIRWTLKHGVLHCICGYCLKQVDLFKHLGWGMLWWGFIRWILFLLVCFLIPQPQPSASNCDRSEKEERSQFTQYLPRMERYFRHF